MQGGRYCDPDLLGLAQVDVDAQVDAEADAEAEMAPHTHHALMHMYCLRNPNAA